MKRAARILAVLLPLAACAGETGTAPPPTLYVLRWERVPPSATAEPLPEPLPGTSGLVTRRGVKPECFAKLSNLPKLVPRADGELPNPNKPVTPPRLIAGSEMPILPREVMVRSLELYIVPRCMLHKEGYISDCNFVCSYPIADKAVLENLYGRRYSPAIYDGAPVDVTYTFQFHITSAP
ncbi:energy transducer TonB [Pendulispora rubella]|uniref:Energy transducer TonB n=1 Tax=Pendulispora rubella TaxID=2741070 RepID=A0ABZ2L3S7_9BACT